MLPDDDKQYAIEICRSSESVLQKWFKNKLHTISAFVGFVIIINIRQVRVIIKCKKWTSRSQWPRRLRRRSSAAHVLILWILIPPGAWMFVCCGCCVLSSRGLCDGLITRPEESYRLWRVVVCDQETSKTRRLKPATGLWKYNHSGL